MAATTIAVLHGDQTGEELLKEALRLLEPGVLGVEVKTRDFDLSLEERRRTRNQCVLDAAAALKELGYGIKAATITPEGSGDVGSPNAILRKQIDGRVIVRTGRRIPGVRPIAGVHAPISVIRMAVDDAYGAREWREGHDLDEWAYRTEKISRHTSRIVADYAFRHARRIEAKVFGGPKFTVSPVYEGMFKEELDAAAERHPDVRYDPHLIDATYALLLATTGEALVIPALNRDLDTLSDLVMQMFGSIAGAESTLLAFDEAGAVEVAMTEAPHGTAPALEGKNVANPTAIIMAVASLLSYMKGEATAMIIAVGLATFLPSRAGAVPWGATVIATSTAPASSNASSVDSAPAMEPNICMTRSDSVSPSRLSAGMTSASPVVASRSA